MDNSVALEGFGGGGSNSLNFKVVGGTTAPVNPKENTIWVNTDQKITGWHFGADEPNFYNIKSDESGYLLSAPHELTEGEIINFIVPATITVGYEWIRFVDGTGQDYCVRNGGGTQLTVWTAGTKISVKISNDLCTMGEYQVRTAYVFGFGNYFHEEGTVWITTGISSHVAFNALKKNSVQVYPLSAKQYISGAWVDKTAKSYQGGEWVELFTGELYKNGIQRVSWNQPTSSAAKMTFATDRVYGMGCIVTANKIDLTRFKTLNAIVTATDYATDQTLRMGIMSSNNTALWDVTEPQVLLNKVASTKTTISLDVSNVTGEYYIALSYNHSTSSAYGTIYEVWME